MSNMFKDCISLVSLDLSSFSTENVMYFDLAFNNCTSLTYLNVSSFKTTNANKLNQMFYMCTSLTSLYLPYFSTNQIEASGLASLFDGCRNLTLSLDKEKCENLKIPDYVNVIDI